MLSYRHAFHAGNFADVHKHAAWLLGIRALHRKPAAFCLLDAYAGAGMYSLDDPAARKTGEWEAGIARLMQAGELPEMLAAYREAIRAANENEGLQRYPGSPVLAANGLREHDRLICLELHPADFPLLRKQFARDTRVQVHRRDAREGLPALLPPREKRGLVLIDPPYEQSLEYSAVPAAVRAAWLRWPTGSYLLWYPLLERNPHIPMLQSLTEGDIRNVLVQELRLFPGATGLQGSGLAWINPPWQADEALGGAAEWLCRHLGGPGANAQTGWRVPE